jgi:hypothetical protein
MSKGKDLLPFGAAIAGDVLSFFKLPGGNTLGGFASLYLQKIRKEAADILIEEVSKGSDEPINFNETDADPLIEIIYRFSKAVADGAARENLRLLAQVIAGLKRNKALEADKFRKWANTLEQLTRDELVAIGKAISIWRKMMAAGPKTSGEFWEKLRAELEASGYERSTVEPLCASLSRTGLILPMSAYGGMVYMPTPWLEELGQLADVEGIAAKISRAP